MDGSIAHWHVIRYICTYTKQEKCVLICKMHLIRTFFQPIVTCAFSYNIAVAKDV